MKMYKYTILRSDTNISIGDVLNTEDGEVKVITIIKIDTDKMTIYFYGVQLPEIDEEGDV